MPTAAPAASVFALKPPRAPLALDAFVPTASRPLATFLMTASPLALTSSVMVTAANLGALATTRAGRGRALGLDLLDGDVLPRGHHAQQDALAFVAGEPTTRRVEVRRRQRARGAAGHETEQGKSLLVRGIQPA